MDNQSAEITKYASNVMLATKISFMNELSRLCEAVGADIEAVRLGTGSDGRIGPKFLFAGAGFGGSCFPKDIRALSRMGQSAGVHLKIPAAVEEINQEQKRVLGDKIIHRLGPDLAGLTVAVWGLAFKPRTDESERRPRWSSLLNSLRPVHRFGRPTLRPSKRPSWPWLESRVFSESPSWTLRSRRRRALMPSR